MKRPALSLLIAAGCLGAAGCGSGLRETAHYTTSPPTTLAGVGAATSDRPPTPSTRTACTARWNGAANAGGRAAAKRKAPHADRALVRTAGPTGYFGDLAGRCLIYLVTPPAKAIVFVETARGRFTFVADASGRFAPNADLGPSGRLRLR